MNLGNINQNYSLNYNSIDNFALEENKSNNNFAKSTAKPAIKNNQNQALSNKLLYSTNNPLNRSNANNLFNSGAILNSLANQPNSVRNSHTKSSNTKLGYFPNYSSNNNNNNNNNFNLNFNLINCQNNSSGANNKFNNYSNNSNSKNINEDFKNFNAEANQLNAFGLNKSNSNNNQISKDNFNSNPNGVYNNKTNKK